MASVSTTANATGQATCAVVILNWWLTGHETPIPTDVAVALGGYLALLGHAVQTLVQLLWLKIEKTYFAAEMPALPQPQPEAPGGQPQ